MRFTPSERERIANCSICRHLSDIEFEDCLRGTGKLPEQEEQLENVPQPAGQYPWIERCPECGTYYTYFHALGYMEDDITLERLSDEEARSFLGQEINGRELSNKVTKA